MAISGARAISFYNPSNGTTVQIDQKDLDQDLEFVQEPMEPDATDASGGTPFVGERSELTVVTYDFAGFSQLKSWDENDTQISAVSAGHEQNLLWHETDRISVRQLPNPGVAGRANKFEIRMVREGQGTHDIHYVTNLLTKFGSTSDSWQDADNDNVADGYSFFNTSSEGFSSNIQSFDTNNNGSASFINTGSDVEFPISGVTITGTSQANTIHSSDQTVVRVEERDFNSSVLSSTSTTFNSTGRESTDLTTGSSVYGIRMYPLRVDSTSAVETVRCVEPALRLDGTNAYAEF